MESAAEEPAAEQAAGPAADEAEKARLVPDAGPQWPANAVFTSDAAVDRALGALDRVRTEPTPAHPAVYADLHDRLLAELNAEAD